MSDSEFIVGEKYTKNDIYRICKVPIAKQKGNWNTGYTNFEGDWFIFCNVGIPGRTGHNYKNKFIGDDLVWFGKNASHVGQESIHSLLHPQGSIFVFYRENNREPYTYAGIAQAKTYKTTVPIEIIWSFAQSAVQCHEVLPEELQKPENFIEDATNTMSVNIYERNPQRKMIRIRKNE